MPWCPKCSNEYKEGVKVCADCGCELIDDSAGGQVRIMFGAKGEMDTLRDFLIYSGIRSAHSEKTEEDDSENSYVLSVSKKEEDEAKKHVIFFLQQKEMERLEAQREATGEGEEDKSSNSYDYQDNRQKAEDNKSSGVMLLGLGILGILLLVLCIIGVIPLRLSATSSYMIYGMMSALFILFIVMGVVSLRSFKIFAKKAEAETSLKSTMEKWCLENLTAELLDEELFGESEKDWSEEDKYFRRIDLLKEKIRKKFLNLDQQFLERFADDIYEKIFES